MVSPDIWLRQQLWQQLWKGPAGVSAYASIAIQLCCTPLSVVVSRNLESPCLYILLINVLICVLVIVVDQIDSYRNHRLGLLRRSVAKSRRRIEALGIKSDQVDRFGTDPLHRYCPNTLTGLPVHEIFAVPLCK